jgi:hypothetical protein
MRQLKAILTAGLVSLGFAGYTQSSLVDLDHFHKVIVSPYIQATFVEGDRESVTINGIIVDSSKLHVEMNHGTLRLYLDGTKDIPHNHDYNDDKQHSHPSYPKHAVIATIMYKKLDALSLRGEETYLCESPLSSNQFYLRVYGESRVIFTEVHFQKLHTTIYGESSLDIKSGVVNKQYYTCYGEGKVNTTGIAGRESKLTAYGEAEFRLNVSDRIKITSIGQAKLRYMGNPDIVKGIHIGGVDMQKLD